jgi:hypothetical protein
MKKTSFLSSKLVLTAETFGTAERTRLPNNMQATEMEKINFMEIRDLENRKFGFWRYQKGSLESIDLDVGET